jgi:CHAD domain-containing protein
MIKTSGLREALQPVLPQDSMAEAGRKILLEDYIRMQEREAGSRTGADIEDVHQMRVATRRMRSAFNMLQDYFKDKPTRPLREGLRTIARSLGVVRDLDVMIADLEAYKITLDETQRAELNSVVASLDKRRRKARKKLVALFDSAYYASFQEQYAAFLLEPGTGVRSMSDNGVHPYQVRHVLPSMIYDHLAAVRAYDTVLEHAEIETLHALRIEFKQLRYILSYFHDVLGGSIDQFINDLKVIQDYLGRLNDLSVAQGQLQALIDNTKLKKPQREILEIYIQQMQAEQQTKAEGFMAVWEHFNTRSIQRKLSDSLLVLR